MMMPFPLKIILFMMMFAVGLPIRAQMNRPTTQTQLAFDTTDYAAVLDTYVDDKGLVEYAGLKSGRAPLDRFVLSLASLDPATFNQFSEDEQIAFWINAYNALTLQLIIDHYPIKAAGLSAWRFPNNSIRQIDGVWKKPEWNIMGRSLSLHDIEHNILRVEFTRPEVHMGLNCASMSCPPLRREPYSGMHLQTQLAENAKRFLAGVFINPKQYQVRISPIFNWFQEDWVRAGYHTLEILDGKGLSEGESAVLAYIRQHGNPTAGWHLFENHRIRIVYEDYDWSLNQQ